VKSSIAVGAGVCLRIQKKEGGLIGGPLKKLKCSGQREGPLDVV
jgi:hypothetical protein